MTILDISCACFRRLWTLSCKTHPCESHEWKDLIWHVRGTRFKNRLWDNITLVSNWNECVQPFVNSEQVCASGVRCARTEFQCFKRKSKRILWKWNNLTRWFYDWDLIPDCSLFGGEFVYISSLFLLWPLYTGKQSKSYVVMLFWYV